MSEFRRLIMMWNRPVASSPSTVPSPTISPSSGSILPSQTITISISGTATSAEYSTDNTNWTTYTSPFTLSSSATVYARATDGNGNYSSVVSQSYIIAYDSRVEYLESSGTQWIDTGVLFSSGTTVVIDAIFTGNYTSTQVLVGPSASGGCWMGNVNVSGGSFGIGSQSSQVTGRSNVRTTLTLEYLSSKTQLTASGTTRNIARSSNPTTTTIKIFSTGASFYSSAKVYSCSISQNGVLVANLLPVRRNGVGYMYDAVSGNLIGNGGTGSFSYGNDITV